MRNSFIGILAFALILFSCEKPESKIGLELLPDEEFLGLEIDSTTVLVNTVLYDSLNTTQFITFLIGEMEDEHLSDVVNANSYLQIRLSDPDVEFGVNPQLDSMVLSFAYTGNFFGELEPMNIKLEQLSEDIFLDSTYFSYSSVPTDEFSLLDTLITPDIESDVIVGDDTLAPQLRLRLDELGELFINSQDSLTDDDTFLSFFKGIKISATREMGQMGGLFGLDPYDNLSKITLYYNNDASDSLSYDFTISQLNQQFSQFEHMYGGDVLDQLSGTITNPDQVYIQTLAGLGIEVTLPNLFDFADEEDIIINRAVLELPLEEGQDLDLFVPNPEISAAIFEDGTVLNTPDGITADQFGTIYEDGIYDEETEMYKLNITRFVQQVLTGEIEEPVFNVIPSQSRTIGNRAIIHVGDLSEDRRIKLIINYTTY